MKLTALLALTALYPTIDNSINKAPVKLRVLMPVNCIAACTCAASVTPTIHTSDAYVSVKTANETNSVDGCCDETQDQACANMTASGCTMGSKDHRIKLLGSPCSCTSMSWETTGAEAEQGQDALGTGVWSEWFTIGGFGMACDTDTDGNLTATCDAGGTPIPRTLLNIDYDYVCDQCGT